MIPRSEASTRPPFVRIIGRPALVDPGALTVSIGITARRGIA